MRDLVDPLVHIYVVVLAALSLFGLRRLWVLVSWLRSGADEVAPPLPDELPSVTVQLPLFNEANVVERLLAHAAALDWPRERLEIQVLDDSTDDTRALVDRTVARLRADGVPIHVLRRADRAGYKAGALTAGMRTAKGELLALFDADFAPAPDFLRRVVPHFADARLAFAQGVWLHVNREASLLTRVQALLLDGHFFFEHTVRSRRGRYVCFAGTAGVWRRAAIDDAGGWQPDTLIEDADLSYRAQLRGWRGLHLPDVVVPCELPDEIHAWKAQQQRWAKGNAQVARKLLGPILRGPASLAVKLEAFVHLTTNVNFPLVVLMALLVVPVTLLGHGRAWLHVFDAVVAFTNVAAIGVYFEMAQREAERRTGVRGLMRDLPAMMAIGLGLAVAQTQAVIEGAFGTDRRFLRTPKLGDGARQRSYGARKSRLWPIELGATLGYACAVGTAVATGAWSSVPFLALFLFGFGVVALWSMQGGYTGAFRAADVEQ